MKTCPFCAEEIQDAAIVCKHCGRELSSKEEAVVPASPPVPTETASPGPSRLFSWKNTGFGLVSGEKRYVALGLMGIGLIAGWFGTDTEGPGVGFVLLPIGVVVLLTGHIFTRVIIAVVALGIALALFVDSTAPSTSETETLVTPPDVPFEITVEAEGQGNQINISGTTNLPDDTQVALWASRAFRGVGRTTVQAANVGGGRTTVSDGSFEAVLSLDLGHLLLGLDMPSGQIEVMDNDVTVCVEVQTGISHEGDLRQPRADVRAVLGVHGEALTTSPQAMSFGSATPTPSTWLEVEMAVALSPDETVHLESVNEAQNPTQAKFGDLQGHCVSR